MGISDEVTVVQIESGVVAGEPLDSGAGATTGIRISLAGRACVGEDGAESGLGVTIAVVVIGVGTCT